jgi:hypothetical protein
VSIRDNASEHSGEERARYNVTTLRRFPKDPAPEFPTNALPPAAARLVKEGAAAIGCPEDFIALSALTVLGAAIGTARVARLKRSWTEGASLYTAVIAVSGEKKTAAIATATRPVVQLEHRLNKEHDAALEEHAAEMREYEVQSRDAKKEGRAPDAPPERPTPERTYTSDATVESLAPILKANPRGLLLERDELVGFVRAMDQYKQGGRGADRQFWLSAWSNRPVTVDRKSQQGQPLSVLRPFVSVLGGIQPDRLPELGAGREDGMLERFLFVYPQPVNALWTEEEISEAAETGYADLYGKLRALSLETDDLGDPVEKPLEFSPDAKQVFVDTYNAHREEMAESEFPVHLRSPWAKLEAYFARLVLIIAASRFVEDGTPERIESGDVLRAALLLDYFKAQAKRVFNTLREGDPILGLMRDVSGLVAEAGGLWTGTATELHDQLGDSPYKPERANELGHYLRTHAHKVDLVFDSEVERYKDEEGKWRSSRVLTLLRDDRRRDF